MGEDVTQDRLQVEQPQEFPQIEQSHVQGLPPEGGQPVEQPQVAPHDQPEGYGVRSEVVNEPAHLGGVALTEKPQAPTALESAAEPADEAAPADTSVVHDGQPSSYIRDKEKAEVMARAQNDAFDADERFPQNASLHAGNEYDMDTAKSRAPGYEVNKAEKDRAQHETWVQDVNERNQILRYSSAIVEHYKEHGDEPTPFLAALAEVHELVQDTGFEDFEIDKGGEFSAPDSVSVTFDKYQNVVVKSGNEMEGKAETFTLSMFHGGLYAVTEAQGDPDQEFDEVLVTRRRVIESKDVKRLAEVLAPAIAVRDEQQRSLEEAWDKHQRERFGNRAG